ncbi:DUF3311 domain-containing protein [Methyloceanibacter sp.]|jgi:hypothetical protein|uniref:DUF3311 domain-containing protein n=1 Tax=Methyloceanibacter sp. TaxID=1965321 RepID=UPI002BF5C8E3|nr:DUF3311 domain-containing protein [Methyloceanibacter sp.]
MAKKTARAGWRKYWPRLLFLIPVVIVLWVPFYNRLEPALGGIPFFYWYQLAWVLIAASIVMSVYVLETRITHTARSDEKLEAPGPPGDLL